MTRAQAAAVAEARRILELSARHQLTFEYTADGWRMVDGDAATSMLPPDAVDDLVVVCESCCRQRATGVVVVDGEGFSVCEGCKPHRNARRVVVA